MVKENNYHLLNLSIGKFMYDRNTDSLLQIPNEVYLYLAGKEAITKYVEEYLINLKSMGLLKKNSVKQRDNPLLELLEYHLKYKMTHIILQVTQNCNLRCEYCVYSGNYKNRAHAEQWMPFEVAKKAIDYLIQHSLDSKRITISFYGGEPLLAFELIKKSVLYAMERGEGRDIGFSFTTNGTLLTMDKMDFLIKYDFNILVSLDGPEKIHDIHRKFATNKTGSFKSVYNNLVKIKEKYPNYYYRNLSFNTVLNPANSFDKIDLYFQKDPILRRSRFSSSIINTDYSTKKISYCSQFIEEQKYALFKLYLEKIRKLKRGSTKHSLIKAYFSDIKEVSETIGNERRGFIYKYGNRGGPCMPGRIRAFVTAEGSIYTCERTSETSSASEIGNINKGIDINKAKKILDLEHVTKSKCQNCWAYHRCKICVAKADDGKKISKKIIEKNCNNMKIEIESNLKDFLVLSSFGYSPDKDFD